MPFGATPVCPCTSSQKPTPRMCTGWLADWKLVVTVNRESNVARALRMADANGLLPPTQAGSGISEIMVCPRPSDSTMW